VHLEKSEIPDDYVALGIEFGRRQVRPLSMEAARRVESLVAGKGSSVDMFRREFDARPILRVPSAIVPRERHYILLPAAPSFSARILWAEPFRFDVRLFSLAAER